MNLASSTFNRMQPWEAFEPSARVDELVGPRLAELNSVETYNIEFFKNHE